MAIRLREIVTAGLWATLAAIVCFTAFGCNDPNQMEMTLQALERGQAQGQLTLTSDGRVSVSQAIDFGFGAGGSALAFSGTIDFKSPLGRQIKESGDEQKHDEQNDDEQVDAVDPHDPP